MCSSLHKVIFIEAQLLMVSFAQGCSQVGGGPVSVKTLLPRLNHISRGEHNNTATKVNKNTRGKIIQLAIRYRSL